MCKGRDWGAQLAKDKQGKGEGVVEILHKGQKYRR